MASGPGLAAGSKQVSLAGSGPWPAEAADVRPRQVPLRGPRRALAPMVTFPCRPQVIAVVSRGTGRGTAHLQKCVQ
jgi:hypothetical protein